jgi:hypothetical protein
MSWAAKEMNGVNLGDERLNRRVIRVLERLGEKPSVSIPTACGGWAETQAAYRFFDNEKVSAEAVLAPHVEATLVRCRNEAVVLCVDDTTELDFTGKNDIVGLGPLSYQAQRGMYLHLTLAVTAERLALGVLAALPWARDPADYGKSAQHSHRPIDEKESIRWLESYRAVSELDRANPNTQFVYAADREADIYEIFAEAAKRPDSADFLIRSQHDRNLASGAKLRSEVAKREALGDVEFDLMARPGHPARRVVATLRAARVRLKCPDNKKLPDVEVTVLHALEQRPPKNAEAVEWFLLTSFLVTELTDTAELFQWYLCRWDIEVFFRVLKSGCEVEELQLEHTDRLEAALAVYLIVAWRVLFLVRLGRTCPDLSCEVVFTPEEWQTVYMVAKRKPPPKEPPKLNAMIRLVASFGGFLGRKGDGEPGPKSLWIGLQRMRDFVAGAQWARSQEPTCV